MLECSLSEFPTVWKTILGLFGKCPLQGQPQALGNGGAEVHQWRNRLRQVLDDDRPGIASERRVARKHLVHRHRQGVLIGSAAWPRRLRELLRGHVFHGADGGEGSGEPSVTKESEGIIDGLRDPKVAEKWIQEDVQKYIARLDVAVQHASLVNEIKGAGDPWEPAVQHAGRGALRFSGWTAAEVIGERATRQKTHHHKQPHLVVVAVVDDRYDVAVLQRQHRLDFLGEPPLSRGVLAEALQQHLDDDGNAVDAVPRPVRHPHSTPAEFREQPVAVSKNSGIVWGLHAAGRRWMGDKIPRGYRRVS